MIERAHAQADAAAMMQQMQQHLIDAGFGQMQGSCGHAAAMMQQMRQMQGSCGVRRQMQQP